MIYPPEAIPPEATPHDIARSWAAYGNRVMCNCWLGMMGDQVTDEFVMELRRLSVGKHLHPERIGSLREPWKFRHNYHTGLFDAPPAGEVG